MASDKTITINGRLYDAVTGLPVEAKKETPAPAKSTPKPAPKPAAARKPATPRSTQNSTAVHSTTTQRGATLSRRVTKKPAAPAKPIVRKPGRLMDVAPQSRSISHFAPHPVMEPAKKAPAPAIKPTAAKQKVAAATPRPVIAKPAPRATADAPARIHPTASRALAKKAVAKPAVKPATAKQIKDAQIEKALAPTPKPKRQPRKAKKLAWLSRRSRRLLIIAGFLVLVGLIIFGIYRLVPSISVGVAASQAGVNATYPEFTPDGYNLKQPVEYSDGQVVLTFHSNSNDNSYTITQTRSSWDSSAVLDNVVKPKVGENYVTTKERGLTIYSYKDNTSATWVNGGVLYTIDSSSALSGDQVRKIATSL